MPRKVVIPSNLSLHEIGSYIGGSMKDDISRRAAFTKLKSAAEEKKQSMLDNFNWQRRRENVLIKKFDGDVCQAIQEHVAPSSSKNRMINQMPFEKKIMEEIYAEQHGKRAHRKLRSELQWERWIAKGDENVPVSRACEKAQLAFGMGKEIELLCTARVPEEFPTYNFRGKGGRVVFTRKSKVFEIPFIGRTNVGKSSLINALLNTYVADYDSSPGTTITANFYCLGKRMTLVDMPGYSYISPLRAPEARIQSVHKLIKSYLHEIADNKRCCPRVFVCLHAKLGVHGADKYFLDMLEGMKVPFSVILTKTDEVDIKRLVRVTAYTRNTLMNLSHCEELTLASALHLSGIQKIQNLLSHFGPKNHLDSGALEDGELDINRIVL